MPELVGHNELYNIFNEEINKMKKEAEDEYDQSEGHNEFEKSNKDKKYVIDGLRYEQFLKTLAKICLKSKDVVAKIYEKNSDEIKRKRQLEKNEIKERDKRHKIHNQKQKVLLEKYKQRLSIQIGPGLGKSIHSLIPQNLDQLSEQYPDDFEALDGGQKEGEEGDGEGITDNDKLPEEVNEVKNDEEPKDIEPSQNSKSELDKKKSKGGKEKSKPELDKEKSVEIEKSIPDTKDKEAAEEILKNDSVVEEEEELETDPAELEFNAILEGFADLID